MSLKIRRILYIFFIIVFLIITPLISIYAAGYKISLKNIIRGNLAIQKTGIFIIDTKPRGAQIYINDKPCQFFLKKYYAKEKGYITTPAKIKNLLPGEYNIKIELEGHWPWQKKLAINPGSATYAEDIYLFKKNLPIILLSDKIQNISASPNKKSLILNTENKTGLYNLSAEELKTILTLDTKKQSTSTIRQTLPTDAAWSPDSKKVIINGSIINISTPPEIIDLHKIIDPKAVNYKWDTSNENVIYYNHRDKINYYNLFNNINKTLFSCQTYNDYLVKDGYLFLVNQVAKSSSINTYSANDGTLLSSLNIPHSSKYQFIHPEHNLLNLYDKKHQILYLIDPLSAFSPLREIINNVKHTKWVDNNKLLYANDFEIWLFDLNKNKKTLLTRISNVITDIFWHPSNNYVIYTTDKTINVIELDDREKRNIAELIKLDNIRWPILNEEGDTLYFYAKIGNQEGLYKLAIQ